MDKIYLIFLFSLIYISSGIIFSHFSQQADTTEALNYVTKACEAVWTEEVPTKLKNCITRTMSALGEDNQLRDNELKNALFIAERDLKICLEK